MSNSASTDGCLVVAKQLSHRHKLYHGLGLLERGGRER